ncbi:hypothetical protein EV200_104165 [Pedobacter psychrotolerans]|uniref:Uncharacterized protein n=1 Tax=Pedobacter psychrotolerans TaxID=1843235 RepID=A0A4R2HBW4_9SPHI|nr:hypothetical protein [Pedobacter psychrotolerans]TCO25129.1 hypothetical protein EV200_104165 [Pedobacter psychrotolerans]
MTREQAEILHEFCKPMVGRNWNGYYIHSLFTTPINGEHFEEIKENVINDVSSNNLKLLTPYDNFELYVLLFRSDRQWYPQLLFDILQDILLELN